MISISIEQRAINNLALASISDSEAVYLNEQRSISNDQFSNKAV